MKERDCVWECVREEESESEREEDNERQTNYGCFCCTVLCRKLTTATQTFGRKL